MKSPESRFTDVGESARNKKYLKRVKNIGLSFHAPATARDDDHNKVYIVSQQKDTCFLLQQMTNDFYTTFIGWFLHNM